MTPGREKILGDRLRPDDYARVFRQIIQECQRGKKQKKKKRKKRKKKKSEKRRERPQNIQEFLNKRYESATGKEEGGESKANREAEGLAQRTLGSSSQYVVKKKIKEEKEKGRCAGIGVPFFWAHFYSKRLHLENPHKGDDCEIKQETKGRQHVRSDFLWERLQMRRCSEKKEKLSESRRKARGAVPRFAANLEGSVAVLTDKHRVGVRGRPFREGSKGATEVGNREGKTDAIERNKATL